MEKARLYLDYDEIGRHIRAERKQKGWSQVNLAKRLGVSPQLISFFENGDSRPSLEMLLRLCLIFGIKLDKLVTIHYEGEKTA